MAPPPTIIGAKVRVVGLERYGLGEIASHRDGSGRVAVDFYRSAVEKESVVTANVRRERIPVQTRCFVPVDGGFRMGRVIGCVDQPTTAALTYHVALPNEPRARQLDETSFRVRSALGAADPVETLGALAQETPFFFEVRSAWVQAYDHALSASRGIHALDAANVELFPHQVEAVRRVLQDPHVRYLLADEVGLGKTIEAGAILRQLSVDAPGLRSAILVPNALRVQWQRELEGRFGLLTPEVRPHEELAKVADQKFDVVVVDEAHRLIGGSSDANAFAHLQRLCASTPHVLLLSATPTLHRDAELLALLHLLDPEQYRPDDVAKFRARLARRAPIGRLLLGLGRANSPVAIRRQLQAVAQELHDDPDVQQALARMPTDTGDARTWRELATEVRVLVSETWRLQRRIVRNRRRALHDEGEIQRLRRLESPEFVQAYGDDPDAFSQVWAAVEELRSAAAATAARGSDDEAGHLRDGYLLLAQAASTLGASFARTLDLLRSDSRWQFASAMLDEIARAAEGIGFDDRLAAASAVLEDQAGEQPRWVVFCSDPADATRAVAYFRESLPRWEVMSVTADVADDASTVVERFLSSKRHAVLVADRVAEEGFNLGGADGVLLLDLPFAPMRLEQRIGRLDRLERTRPLRIVAVLSQDDSSDGRLAFDRAWYELLGGALGLFEDSIADVPYVLERLVTDISRVAFERGPAALYDQVGRTTEDLAAERSAIEEQDVIDGTAIAGVRTTDWWKALDEADADEDTLASAFERYVTQSVALVMHTDDSQRTAIGARRFSLRRDRSRDVLLPPDALVPLAEFLRSEFTFSRRRATKERGATLLRPGARLLDWVRELADWDDRGRAFAVWRKTPTFLEPRTIVRVILTVTLPDVPTEGLPRDLGSIGAASLRRLAAEWFAPLRIECFLRADSSSADDTEVQLCRARYDKRIDENLGGPRGAVLADVVGTLDWASLCRRWAATAIENTRAKPELRARLAHADHEARAWFAHRDARLLVRERSGDVADVAHERRELAMAREYVLGLICEPLVRVDAMGIYVLAAAGCPT